MCSELVVKLNRLISGVQQYCNTNPEEAEFLERAVHEAQALKYFLEKHQTNLFMASWSLLHEFEEWLAAKTQPVN